MRHYPDVAYEARIITSKRKAHNFLFGAHAKSTKM